MNGWALEEGVAVYILGGFGGAAEQVAAAMSGNRPDTLTLDSFMRNSKYQALSEAAHARGRSDELKARLDWLWKQLRRSNLSNGLTKQENATLWDTADVGLTVALVSKGLRSIDLRTAAPARPR